MTKLGLGQEQKGLVLDLAGGVPFPIDHILPSLGHLMSPGMSNLWTGLVLVVKQMFGRGLVKKEEDFKVAEIEDSMATETLIGNVCPCTTS